MIRVSLRAAEELRSRAEARGLKVVWVVDELVFGVGAVVPVPAERSKPAQVVVSVADGAVPPTLVTIRDRKAVGDVVVGVIEPARCPKCHHLLSVHQLGANEDRCGVCLQCRWKPTE